MNSAWYNMITKIPFGYSKKVKQGREVAMALKKALKTTESVFIDVGCHKGAVLDLALKIAPKGDHYAFEAIPAFYEKLIPKFENFVYLKNTAITNYIGETEFTVVESNPSLSGIKERDYPKSEKIVKIKLKANTLDNALSDCQEVDVIRVDVEGGEFEVIDGAKGIIFKHKPIIMFEHQQGAADYYKNGPDKMWNLVVDQLGMKIFTLSGYINRKKEINKSHFKLLFDTGQETLFVASYEG
jgi:FkbM family methyltransferase